MAVTLTCPTCNHKVKVADDEVDEARCPYCDEALENVPIKLKPRDDAEEEAEDDDRPSRKKKKKRSGGSRDNATSQDSRSADRFDLPTGFDDDQLMEQVEGELSRAEVVHFACRPSTGVAKIQAVIGAFFGVFFAVVGTIVALVMLSNAKSFNAFALIPVGIVVIGLLIAVFAPIMKLRQARLGWYAVTDRRAIVFHVSLFGSSGHATTYTPGEMKRMRIARSWLVSGAGDIIFRTEVHTSTRHVSDGRGRHRTETSTSTTHYGFLGIERVRDVEALIHEVLLSDDGSDDDRPRRRKRR